MARAASLLVRLFYLVFVAQSSLGCSTRYHISDEMYNWHEAIEYCNRLGFHSAILDTPAKHAEAVALAKSTGRQSTGKFGLWLGGSDLGKVSVFVWQPKGVPVTWANWKAGEPTGGNEHCMNMYYWPTAKFAWTVNDAACFIQMYALCQSDFQGE